MLNHWMCYLNWISGNMNVNTKTEPYYALLLYPCLLFSVVFFFVCVCVSLSARGRSLSLSKHALYTVFGMLFFLLICRFLSGLFFALNSVGA